MEKLGFMSKSLVIKKAKFDSVLKKLAHSSPVKKSDVQIDSKTAKSIAPQR